MILTITGFLLQEFIIPQDLPKINKIRDWDLEINIKNYQNSQYCETEIKYKYPEYGNYAENVRYLHSKTTSYFFLCLFSHTLLFFSNRRYVIYKKTFLFLIIGNFTCLFVAFIGFTVPWGHNCWFEHYSQFKEFENQVYENINRNRIF